MDIYTFFGTDAHFSLYWSFWFSAENIVLAGILALFSENLPTIRERRAHRIQRLGDRFAYEAEVA
jgi:hypothetical protein